MKTFDWLGSQDSLHPYQIPLPLINKKELREKSFVEIKTNEGQ